MSSNKSTNKITSIKTFDFNKQFNFNSKKKNKKNGLSSLLATIGVLVNIIWFLSIFLNPPLDPQTFITLGISSFVLTVLVRFFTRFSLTSQTFEIQSGGSIVGFVVTWALVQFYSQRSASVNVLGYTNTVDQILSYLLIGAFIIWFFIPSKSLASQELIFNLPPLFSYFILNMWKILVILKIMVKSWNITQLDSVVSAILLLICIIEIIGMYQRIFKLDITDIILDLRQILIEIIRGPLVSIRWAFLILGLILFNFLQSDIIVLMVLGFAIFMSIISFMTFISKLSFDAGLFQRKADQTKAVAPKIFNEIKELKIEDFHENYYQVVENFQLRRKTKIKGYSQGDILFRIPLKETVESLSGIYIANLSFEDKQNKKVKTRKTRKSVSFGIREEITNEIKDDIRKDIKKNPRGEIKFNLQVHSVGKFTKEEWENIVKSKKVINVSSDDVIRQIGFTDKEQFNSTVEQGLKNFSRIQDGLRDRIRGVPTSWTQPESYTVESFENGIVLPKETIDELKKKGITKLEIIPGKDEFLFYVKKKT